MNDWLKKVMNAKVDGRSARGRQVSVLGIGMSGAVLIGICCCHGVAL